MSYEIGSRVGDYEILQVLGAGGMGRVYKVRNVISDRIEAMKVLLPDLEGNPGLADRFMREIKVQASLDHPNIAALYTAQRIENQLIMLMEYVEGTTLDKMMESGPIPIDKAADHIAQVLSALAYAHARGVVHRDLKPANMMVTASGLVKLMDFGIAKMTADRKLTQTGSTVGSLYYMSPEQIQGSLDLDPRSDLYSLGVSLYEIVTGARPFQGDSEYSIMAAHLQSNPPPPIQISPKLPPGLNEIILQALEKDPARRFQTADAFRNALLYVCKGGQAAVPAAPVAAPPPVRKAEPVPPPPKPQTPPAPSAQAGRSHRGLWIALGAVLAIAVLVVAAMQIPKFRRAAAEGTPTQPPVASQTAEPQTSQPAATTAANESQPITTQTASTTDTQSAQPAAPAQTTPATTQVVEGLKPARPAVAPRAPGLQISRPDAGRQSAAVFKSTASLAPANAAQQSAPVSARPEQPAQSYQPVQSAPSTPSEDPKVAEQLKEVRQQLDLLNVRADTVKGSLDALRRQQAASGLGLRADMANAAQRMEMFLSQTEKALRQRDADAAKKNLDSAEREVSKLENFLHK
jgi:eukaryotic-like serine/threonine-protein kinase